MGRGLCLCYGAPHSDPARAMPGHRTGARRRDVRRRSTHLVQPADRCALGGVPERLEFLVPRLA